jgi:hypothetical protein
MGIKRNPLNAGTPDANVTVAGTGLMGDAISSIVVNNSTLGSGGATTCAWKTDAAMGGSVAARITLAAGSSYLRANDTDTGTRFGARRRFRLTGDPSADAQLMSIHGLTGGIVALRINSSGRAFLAMGATTYSGSLSPAGGLDADVYVAEVIVTLESGGGGNGSIKYGIWKVSDGTLVHEGSVSSLSIGTAVPDQYRFGGLTSSVWASPFDDISDIAWGAVSTTWIGPAATLLDAPQNLDTTITNATPGNEDGSILLTWDEVDGAEGYEVAIVGGEVTEGFTAADTTTALEYLFENLPTGEFTVAVRAV